MLIARSLPFPAFTRSTGQGFGKLARAVWRVVSTRRALADLDDRMLQDLGISRAQAQFEASKSIWALLAK
jgi:uncharacterized protein YjiS (DUF1127 family)